MAINEYLKGFKDDQGEAPDPMKVAVMVQQYCDNYIKTTDSKFFFFFKNS